MIHNSKFILAVFFAAVLGIAAGAGAATSGVVSMGGTLAAANEVPANPSTGTGVAEVKFDPETSKLSWKVTYTGLSGPAAAAHFHGPALSGQNAGVVLGFQGSVASPIEGEATLTPAQSADLLAGKWYVNVHTKANPGGELRAQIVAN